MAAQRYVSPELTHFVGQYLKDLYPSPAEFQEQQYCLLIKILREGQLGKIFTGPVSTGL
jgi:hypothetical protein